jgi:hypothetical protein
MLWRASMSHALAVLLVAAASVHAGCACARAESDFERRVKSVFLYKFAPYVKWPREAQPDADGPFVIATTNAESARDISQVTAGRTVHGHPVRVRFYREGESASGINVLFVPAADSPRLSAIVAATRGRPVLLVSDAPDGIEIGAVINFVVDAGRVRFQVSLPAAEERHLQVSSRLLNVAQTVRTGNP